MLKNQHRKLTCSAPKSKPASPVSSVVPENSHLPMQQISARSASIRSITAGQKALESFQEQLQNTCQSQNRKIITRSDHNSAIHSSSSKKQNKHSNNLSLAVKNNPVVMHAKASKRKLPGYCENCRINYADLHAHTQTQWYAY